MHNGRYLFGFFLFFVFLTILLILVAPNGPGNSRISSYYTQTNSSIHYAQVPEGTNMTACIVIDNTPFTSFDLINYSLKARVVLQWDGSELILNQTEMKRTFTVYKNEVVTIRLDFNASKYGHSTISGILIIVDWGIYDDYTDDLPMGWLEIGPIEVQEEAIFTFTNVMIWISAIGIGITLLIISLTARQDFQAYRKSKRAPARPAPTTPAPEERLPAVPTQPSVAPPSLPTTALPLTSPPISMESRPIETMILIPCPQCHSKIDKSQAVCPTCGHEFQKCVVCNLIIDEDEETESCPECGALAHRDHFREWVHINGKCPICKKPLTF